MTFNPRLPNDTATLLLVASFIIVLIGLVDASGDPASHHITDDLDHRRDRDPVRVRDLAASVPDARLATAAVQEGAEPPRIGMTTSLVLLGLAGVARRVRLGLVRERARADDPHAPHLAGVRGPRDRRDRGQRRRERGRGSCSLPRASPSSRSRWSRTRWRRSPRFLYPLLVLVSLLTATSLTFTLAPVYIGALFGTAILVWQITGDGEATPFEGVALMATFVILATVAAFE